MRDDCISRQAVINESWMLEYPDGSEEMVIRASDIMELPPVTPQPKTDVLDKIRAEIDGIEINGQVDEHTMFIRTGEQVKQMALDIIDKYKSESEG